MLSHIFTITILLLSSFQMAEYLRHRGCQSEFLEKAFRQATQATHKSGDLRQVASFCRTPLFFSREGHRYQSVAGLNQIKTRLFLK